MSVVRRSLQVVAFLCTLLVGVASMALIVTQTAWFRDWLRGFIVRQADEYVNGDLSIGRLDGNLFFGVRLGDVDIRQNGKTVVGIDDVDLDYNAFSFISGDVVLDHIRLTRPVLRVERTADGRLNLARLLNLPTPDPNKPKSNRTVDIAEVGVSDATLYVEPGTVGTSGIALPERIEHLDTTLAVKSNSGELTVDIGQMSLRADAPSFGLRALSGVVRRTEHQVRLENVALRTDDSAIAVTGTIDNIDTPSPVLDLHVTSDKVALAEIARLVPALRSYTMQPALDVRATGPTDRLAVTLTVSDATAGKVSGNLVVNAVAPSRRVAGVVHVEHFNLAPVLPDVRMSGSNGAAGPRGGKTGLTSDITGQAKIDLVMPEGRSPLRGTYSMNASRIVVLGYQAANVVARGRLDGSRIRVDATAGRAAAFGYEATDVKATAAIDGARIRFDADANAYGGHATSAGTIRTASPLELDLQGHAEHVDLRNLPASLRVPVVPSDIQTAYTLTGRGDVFSGTFALDESSLAGATLASGTTGSFAVGQGAPQYAAQGQVSNLDLQKVGEYFEVSALAAERYRSTINATFDVSGSGGGSEYPLTLDATGTAVDSTVFGATFPKLDFTTNLADGDAHIKANGNFENLNPATLSGNERSAGMFTGTADVETTLRGYADGVTVDSIDLSGRVTLGFSTVGEMSIDMADIEGRYSKREGELTKLAITGADVMATAQGPISLTDEGSTNVKVHLETASLDEVGKIVGQPLKGAADVDATVTGNARKLEAKGTLKGSNLGYGENEALSLTSNFDVTVPELTPADAVVRASNMATFLEVGGQKITEFGADVTYQQNKLDFQTNAKEGVRQLDATGSVIFHPDHQEIVLPTLALRSEQIVWQTPSGAEARIQYSKDRIAVDGLQLVNGDQRISADGVVGSEQEPLRVKADNLDVAQIDALFLGDQRIGGRLSAEALVTGSLKEPRAEGTFGLSQGSFQTYKFESLAGKVAYVPDGVNLDIKLQQSESEWLTAKGTAPLTLFKATPADKGEHRPATPGDSINLEVASSQIGLAAIQGFTSAVTNVTGVMQANLKVTGSGYDPHVEGSVDIRGGSFAVPEFGTRYTGLDTRVDLTPEGLSIQEFKILDDRGFPMTVGGTLALHARSVGAVDVTLKSQKFEVIDNKVADLKLNTDVHITGELRKPKVQGFVEVENGTIHIAQLLERYVSTAYATEDAAPDDGTLKKPAEGAEAQPSVFDALEMDLALSIPSNLVIKGEDLQAPNSSVSIGDMNLTVGGVLQLRKQTGGGVRLVGDVNTVRGTYVFQGRRFDILRDGRIGFSGAEEIDPLLDLRARREISSVETFIQVRGTMKKPELTFTSNPPLEEADILALIIFNQPINELGESDQASLTERAGVLAGGYFASPIARSIGNALQLDEFEIQAQDNNGGGGPSLTVGEQIGRNLFVRLRQVFGSEQTTELILEYQIREYLRAQGSIAEGNTTQRVQFRRIERGGLDLIFFFSY